MNMLTVYTLEQSESWDTIVCTFTNYDVYYLSGYTKAFHLHGDGEPMLFFYEGDGVHGINVVMKRDIARDAHFRGKLSANTYFDFATPYGYGGWLIEGNGDTARLFKEYQAWCQNHNVVSEFVRFHPLLKNHALAATAYEVISLGETIAMDLSARETIWTNITSKNRNMIRKAIRSGVRIYNGRCAECFESFRNIYNATMDKDHAENYYYFDPEFYKSILEDLPQNAQVFYAEHDSQIISASIMLAANGRLNYHLSGSVRQYQNLAPTNLLLYQAALWGYANGCKTLHLGGGVGSSEDSLFQFKRAFYRGNLYRFYIGRKIFAPNLYDQLVGIRDECPESGFFPKYRA